MTVSSLNNTSHLVIRGLDNDNMLDRMNQPLVAQTIVYATSATQRAASLLPDFFVLDFTWAFRPKVAATAGITLSHTDNLCIDD
jgi:hypothetical protein